ncbi:aminotransferase class I/II-fold pyridoxal phosphate-dependent enzyme [Lentisphaerota bacterium ZTH]|nr:UDP-4-amino-4-deoxy-L-arabinose aminotransferase [Lentisphaerota bacterium]WET06476.1 aminotransferase class I/II-fold pyridoxal phosphate-dependent enzyme [Lentisphaerota bacterium ZTH]
MRSEFLPFTRPVVTDNDIQEVVGVLKSGWLTNGPKNVEFEEEICKYTGGRFGVSLASATGGMHILLKSLGIGPGDEVITPSLTWVSTTNLITLCGATPVFAEIDRDTMLVTPETIEACVTERTKAIIPVHYTGVPVDLDGIQAVADKHGIPIIEDAAHALGTFYKGRHIGQDNTAVYSFHAIKNITCGEGGMIVTDDEELLNKIKMYKFHGLGVDAFDRQNKGRSPQAEVLAPGFKYNLTDICAALGLSQLRRIDEINARRTALAMQYRELLSDIDDILPLSDPAGYDFKHAWHLFIVRVASDKISRDDFMLKLKEKNIGSGIHFRANHLQKYYREVMGFKPGMLPATEWNSDRICSLPLFPAMTENDVQDVVTAIKEVMANV